MPGELTVAIIMECIGWGAVSCLGSCFRGSTWELSLEPRVEDRVLIVMAGGRINRGAPRSGSESV